MVQTALRNVIEPTFERDFAEHSYGFRPRRGAKDALRRVDELLNRGYHWVVDADIKSYFDSISHDKLMAKVAQKISDGRILELTESYLKAGVMEQSKGWEPTEQGTPQGGVVSPLLANIYLLCTLLSTLWTVGDFTTVYLVSGGGPASSTDVLATLGFHYAFDAANPALGVAAVMSALPVLIPIVILLMRKLQTNEVEL